MAETLSQQANKTGPGSPNGANGFYSGPLPVVNSNGDAPPSWEASGHNINYAEFLDWADEDTLAEWVGGDIVMSSPETFKHQELLGFINTIVDLFLCVNDLGRTIFPKFLMKLPNSARAPDLLFISKQRETLIGEYFVNGPADLAVEIVSPESVDRDHKDKFLEYAAGGVSEYWLLDAINDTAAFYQLDAEGHYQAMPLDEQGRYFSSSIAGFWLKPEWLWRQPLPNTISVLATVGGQTVIDYYNAHLQSPDDEL